MSLGFTSGGFGFPYRMLERTHSFRRSRTSRGGNVAVFSTHLNKNTGHKPAGKEILR
jgi:hypothetical protein